MVYAFNDAKAAERHETQYFEMFCNRGIYHKGWTAVTRHSTPWVMEKLRPFDDDVWELYDTNKDWTQAHDLAKQSRQAARAPTPIPDRSGEVQRAAPRRPAGRALQSRPRRAAAAHSRPDADPLRRDGPPQRELVLNIKNKSYAVTAEV